MNDSETLIRLTNAGIFKNKKWLVRDVDLEIKRGQIVTLIGPNGSGKTTTAKIALGLYKTISGRVERNTTKISYVPQKVSIDWTLPLRVADFMVLTQNLKVDDIDSALNLTGVQHLKDNLLQTTKQPNGPVTRAIPIPAIIALTIKSSNIATQLP